MLAVEDEPGITSALEDMLQALGRTTLKVATQVDGALTLIRSHEVDAAIFEVNVHGERSYPVADQLAAKGMPFAFATGHRDSEPPEKYGSVVMLTTPLNLTWRTWP
ncbi:response regulator [Roseomonas harenae]|uniref:response regulator n=1 Tax=Muricoccus harenae TaxID=2692566 RepID=UPI001331AFF0|nr:response regulator [Roseomonas harenae]